VHTTIIKPLTLSKYKQTTKEHIKTLRYKQQ